MRLAREARQWAEAERLQRTRVDWNRQHAALALATPPAALDGAGRNAIRSLAASLHELGEVERELGQPECVAAYEESLRLAELIGETAVAATCAYNLGSAYQDIPAPRDLGVAERWYRRSLALFGQNDRLARSKCLSQLGSVAHERFKDARAAQQPEAELLGHLNAAAQYYEQALKLDPPDALDDLAVDHSQLANIYGDAAELDRALPHYREAIRYCEMAGDLYNAGQYRRNAAIDLANAGRLADALLYARAALRNFATFGEQAAAEMAETQRTIAEIEALQRKGGAG